MVLSNRDKRLFKNFRFNGLKVLAITRAFKLACELSRYAPYNVHKEKFKHYADTYFVRREPYLVKYEILKSIIRGQ